MKYQLETKFNKGDLLYHIDHRWINAVCEACNNTKQLQGLNGAYYPCSNCNFVPGKSFRNVVIQDPLKVYNISVKGDFQIDSGMFNYTYYCIVAKDQYLTCDEKDLFLTKEEAQAECNRRNGK